jgi:DNA polymerase III subunit gamma/tau
VVDGGCTAIEPVALIDARSPVQNDPIPTPHRAIYRRWRAQRFGDLIGQDAIVTTLRNAVRLGRVGHAYLFAGPRGTGKTSTARILAKAINCTNPQDGEPDDACPSCVSIREGRALDLVEIDAASNRGIDQIRELREKVRYAPTDLRRKIYILDEAHQITKDGWAALLKTLEEPPEHVVFMFASTDPQEIPATILSRVQRFDFRRLKTADIAAKLDRILADAGREADPDAVDLIARLAAGGMRDAESMLDQLLSTGDGTLTADGVRDLLGLADEAAVRTFVDALVSGDAGAGIAVLDDLEERGRDPRTFGEQVIDGLRAAIALRLRDPSAGTAAGRASLADLARAARRLAGADLNRNRSGGARLALELALLTSLADAPASPAVGRSAEPETAAAATSPPVTAAPAPAAGPVAAQPPERDRSRGRVAASIGRPAPLAAGPGPGTSAVEKSSPLATVARTPAAPGSSAVTSVQASAAAPTDDQIALVRSRWTEILATVGSNPAVRPLIKECRPIAVEGKVIVLGFPEDKAFLATALERRRAILEQGISQVLGAAYGVRCVATNVEDMPAFEVDEDGRSLLDHARRIFEAAGEAPGSEAGETADVREIS